MSLEVLMLEIDEKIKDISSKISDKDKKMYEEIEKYEREIREKSIKGNKEARQLMLASIKTALEKMSFKEDQIDKFIKEYHVDYFSNIYTGSVIKISNYSPVDKEIAKYFSRFSIKLNSKEEKLNMLAQIIYQELYGFSILDMLVYDDGFDEIGASRHDYIWIQYKGIKKRIPNPDFKFKNEDHYKKIIEDRLTSTAREELNAGNPIIYTVLENGARVTAARPPLSRYHTVGIRLFNYQKSKAEEEFIDKRIKKLIELIVKKGRRNVAIIGEQGSGKTTLADILISMISKDIAIGLAENTHELNLSVKYPEKNIIEFQYGKEYSPSDVMEMFFRFNRDIVIFGEVRGPLEAFEMTKAMLRQARGSMFTFHTSSVERMIHDLRQLLMQTGYYTDYKEASFDVADAINIVIHIKLDRNTGHRYIYRVAEIEAISNNMTYKINDLFVYNKENGKYYINPNGISKTMIKSCLEYEMTQSDIKELEAIFKIEEGDSKFYEYA